MCKCTSEIKTPFCGKLGCQWPKDSLVSNPLTDEVPINKASPGDARCNYCDGPMPCHCPRPADWPSPEEEAEKDLEDRNSYDSRD